MHTVKHVYEERDRTTGRLSTTIRDFEFESLAEAKRNINTIIGNVVQGGKFNYDMTKNDVNSSDDERTIYRKQIDGFGLAISLTYCDTDRKVTRASHTFYVTDKDKYEKWRKANEK